MEDVTRADAPGSLPGPTRETMDSIGAELGALIADRDSWRTKASAGRVVVVRGEQSPEIDHVNDFVRVVVGNDVVLIDGLALRMLVAEAGLELKR